MSGSVLFFSLVKFVGLLVNCYILDRSTLYIYIFPPHYFVHRSLLNCHSLIPSTMRRWASNHLKELSCMELLEQVCTVQHGD